MKKRKWAWGLAGALLAAGLLFAAPQEAFASTLPDGIYVGGYPLGGLTKDEAQRLVQGHVAKMENQKVTLEVDGQEMVATAKDLGFYWSNKDAVDQAASVYQGGNLIQRYLRLQDIAHENVKIPLETAVDENKVAAFVNEKCAPLMKQPQNATITRQEGHFVVTDSAPGRSIDVEGTKKALEQALAGGLDQPVKVRADVIDVQPAITRESLETIQDVLGTFSTDFSSSGASRAKNLRVGAGKVNGHVLMPGETLSGYECMKPFTTANGYATAAAYENGQVVDSVGGGVCQIATTLYNAALQAEVKITQRQNHSMIVTYVKPSMDAAIAGTYKDIKFTNDYPTPIYVEGHTTGRKLTFTIYGKETRPANRKVEYVSETLSTMDPGPPIEQVDPSLAPGARVRVQSSHQGLTSRLWKVVYVDGAEQSRELLHTDTYNASKAIYRVGPAAPALQPSVPPLPQPDPGTQEPVEPQPAEGNHQGPGMPAPPAEGPGALPQEGTRT